MKKVLLFTTLIGLGFAGGSIMPTVMADTEDSKKLENCNCTCGPAETSVMVMPSGSDMLLTTGLIEAISNDSDNSLSKEELVTILTEIQNEQVKANEQTAVMGASTEVPSSEANTTVSSYREMIQRFLTGNLTTTIEEGSDMNTGTTSILGISTIMNQETTSTIETKKTKNNNGLGNGSEDADGVSSDIKGIDPSNPGQKNSKTSVNSTSSVKSSKSVKSKAKSSKSKEKKEKNNNGLGNGSEPADGTSTDIKGIDPSNPGNGSSKNNAGN
jgi:hypothetical protein